MRVITAIASTLVLACSARDSKPAPSAEEGSHRKAAAPAPVLEASIPLDEGGSAVLEGGARVHVLPGTGPAESSAVFRLVPADAVVGLPHTGASARVGPALAVTVPDGAGRPVLVEIPVPVGALPGGLTTRNTQAAAPSAGTWTVLPCLLDEADPAGPRLAASVARSATIAILADASRSTPRADGLSLALLALVPVALGPSSLEGGQEEASQPEAPASPLYVLEAPVGSIALGGEAYDLLETKDRAKDGTPRLLAVRRRTGGFVTKRDGISTALLAHAVREKLAGADLAGLASMLRDDASFLEIASAPAPDMAPLAPVLEKYSSAPSPGPDGALERWQEILGDEEARRGVEAALVHLEIHRTREMFDGLGALLSSLDAKTDDGGRLLDIYLNLAWVLARMETVRALAEGDSPLDPATSPPWHDAAALRRALDPGAKPKKGLPAPSPDLPTGTRSTVLLEAAAEAMRPIDASAPALASLLAAASDLIPAIASLPPAEAGDWIGMEAIRAAAAEIASRPARMAPPPETEIRKTSFSSGVLTITASGTDEDGRVTGLRWWFDDDQDPHLVKGTGSIKAKLAGLKSGSHDVFVAAVDDDGQRDPTAARVSFYVRRTVDIDTQGLSIGFEADPWNVNSEHARAIRTFVRRLEGPVQECADTHYRWGIDGGGKVTLGFEFKGGKSVNVAQSASIVKDTFKNVPLADCIRRAVKLPRMEYNQPYAPAAKVTLTFALKPVVLFFDAASLGDAPGPDVMGAALYLRCTDKTLRKVEAWCDAAVRALPGPWDAAPWPGEEAGEGEGIPEAAEAAKEVAVEAAEAAAEVAAEAAVEEAPAEEAPAEEPVVIPPPEFDAIEIHADCVTTNLAITIETCMVHLTKKRIWCADSCVQKARKCAKQCKNAGDWAEDPYMCRESCWTEEAFSCAEHCAVKNTPLGKPDLTDETAGW